MPTGNASQTVPPVVTSIVAMARSSAAAQQPMPTAASHPTPSAT